MIILGKLTCRVRPLVFKAEHIKNFKLLWTSKAAHDGHRQNWCDAFWLTSYYTVLKIHNVIWDRDVKYSIGQKTLNNWHVSEAHLSESCDQASGIFCPLCIYISQRMPLISTQANYIFSIKCQVISLGGIFVPNMGHAANQWTLESEGREFNIPTPSRIVSDLGIRCYKQREIALNIQ